MKQSRWITRDRDTNLEFGVAHTADLLVTRGSAVGEPLRREGVDEDLAAGLEVREELADAVAGTGEVDVLGV